VFGGDQHVARGNVKERVGRVVIAVLGVGGLIAGELASQSKSESMERREAIGDWEVTGSSTGTVAVHNRTKEEVRFGPLVSIVGPVVSYVDRYVSEGGAHPSSGCSLESVTLGEKENRAAITEIFEEDEVLFSLVHALAITANLKGGARNLADLQERLGSSCEVSWEDLPYSFAVMDLRGNTAVVRFGIGHGCEAARGMNTQFDVLIPVPEDRQAWFHDAVKKQTLGMNETCGGTHEWRCCLEWSREPPN